MVQGRVHLPKALFGPDSIRYRGKSIFLEFQSLATEDAKAFKKHRCHPYAAGRPQAGSEKDDSGYEANNVIERRVRPRNHFWRRRELICCDDRDIGLAPTKREHYAEWHSRSQPGKMWVTPSLCRVP